VLVHQVFVDYKMYKQFIGICWITGVSIGIEFTHLNRNGFTLAINLGIVRIIYARQKLA